MNIKGNAAIMPQDVVTEDFVTEGYATEGFAPQQAATAGFTTEDVVWAVGIWSVILTLSPVIVFYMLMVA